MSNALETNDVQLTAGEVGRLENAPQVINFFARLKYNVDEAMPLDHAALGLDTGDLPHLVHAIYLVATDPDDVDIRVYLLEVRSVTVQLRQKLARRFRERPENALLVLTGDGYETLDFVLLERTLARGTALGQPLKQVIRPRALTISRRNPDPVALRNAAVHEQIMTRTDAQDARAWAVG